MLASGLGHGDPELGLALGEVKDVRTVVNIDDAA